MTKYLLLLMFGALITLASCEKEMDEDEMEMETDCDLEEITYNADIKSILSGCTGSSCHGSGTGREMTDFTTTKAFAQEGRILGALNRTTGFSAMPKGGSKLAQCSIDKVAKWIQEGFPEG